VLIFEVTQNPAKVALTALMRKLIELANVHVQQDRTWKPKTLDQGGYAKGLQHIETVRRQMFCVVRSM